MTVKELIEALNAYDPKLEVRLDTIEGHDFLPISQVYDTKGGVVIYGSVFDQTSSDFDTTAWDEDENE